MKIPESIKLKKESNLLELTYQQLKYQLPAEYLRVYSPSAEVQGHGKPILQYGKKNVKIVDIKPAGQYALKLVFDDGHDTGLYTWEYLHKLALEQEALWADYLMELKQQQKLRDPSATIVRLIEPKKSIDEG